MPQRFYKTAGVAASSMDDFVKILKNTGKDFKHGTAEEAAKKVVFGDAGSGSIVADAVKKLPKAILPFKMKDGERLGDKVYKSLNKGYEKMQYKLSDLDMKGGSKVYDALDKTKVGKKINGAFVYNHQIPLKETAQGKPNEILEVGVHSLSAPLEKAKKKALPIAGAFGINSVIGNYQEAKRKQEQLAKQSKQVQEGGDTVDTKIAYSRNELIEKIAGSLSNSQKTEIVEAHREKIAKQANVEQKTKMEKAAGLAKVASEMLKVAAQEKKQMLADMEKLAMENKRLHLEAMARERVERATKLAESMNEKGMIKKADVEQKINDIMVLEDDAYSILKEAVDNMQIFEQKNGIDNLTFLEQDDNIKSRKSLADEINEAAGQY